MTVVEVLRYFGLWSAVGVAVFSAFVVAVFRTGLVWTARGEEGLLKQHLPASGYLAMGTIPLGIVALQVLANVTAFGSRAATVGLLSLYLLNLGHYLVLSAYDALVIDILVLCVWRPRFLRLPDAIGWDSMRRHALRSLPVGAGARLVLAAITTALSHYAFLI